MNFRFFHGYLYIYMFYEMYISALFVILVLKSLFQDTPIYLLQSPYRNNLVLKDFCFWAIVA